MPYFPPLYPAGGGTIENLDTEYEIILGASGVGIPLTSGSAGNLGSPVQLKAATDFAWAGFRLSIGPNVGNHRYMVDLSFNNQVDWVALDRYARPGQAGSAGMLVTIPTPLNVAAASNVWARSRCPTGSVVANVGIIGIKRTAQSRPLFDDMEMLLDRGATQPSTVSVPMTSTVTWTELVASTSQAYGALQAAIGEPTSAPSANKSGTLLLAIRPAADEPGEEIIISADPWYAASSNPLMRSPPYSVIERYIAEDMWIGACMLTDTPGPPDSVVVGLTGWFNP